MNRLLKKLKIVSKSPYCIKSSALPSHLRHNKLLGLSLFVRPEILFNSDGRAKLTDFYRRMLALEPQLKFQTGQCLRCDDPILKLSSKHFCRSCAQEMRKIQCHVACGACGVKFSLPLHAFRTWVSRNFEDIFCSMACSAENKSICAKIRNSFQPKAISKTRTLRSSVKSALDGLHISEPSPMLITEEYRRWPREALPHNLTKTDLRSVVSRIHPSVRFPDGQYEPFMRPMLETFLKLSDRTQDSYRNCTVCGSIWLGGRATKRPSACAQCREKIRAMWCEVACGACGKTVVLRYSDMLLKEQGKASKVYCNKKCFHAGKVLPVPLCTLCGKKCRARKNKYCSSVCAHKAKRKHLGARVECPCCKEIFIQKTRATRTCSTQCSAKYRKMISSDPINIRRMAYYSYCGQAKAMMALVAERENGFCAICSAATVFKADGGRAHEVHHIDSNKENNAPGNLLYLCKSCHSTAHHAPGTDGFARDSLRALAEKLTDQATNSLRQKILTLQMIQAETDVLHATSRLSQVKGLIADINDQPFC